MYTTVTKNIYFRAQVTPNLEIKYISGQVTRNLGTVT